MKKLGAVVAGFFGLMFAIAALGQLAHITENTAAFVATLTFSAGMGCLSHKLWTDSRQAPPTDRLVHEATEFFDYVNRERSFPPASATALIDRADKPLLAACNCKLFELKSSGTTHLGTRVKLGNIPLYLGSSSRRNDQFAEAGSGELGITADSLLFTSPTKSVDIRVDKITSVTMLTDGVQLAIAGRAKPLLFMVPNGLLWGQLVKNVAQLQLQGRRLPERGHLQFIE